MRTQPYRLPSRTDYRPRTSLAALTLKATIRDSISRAKATVPPNSGRLSRCNDVTRFRPFDLAAVEACISELVAAKADADAVRGIGLAIVANIESRLALAPLTIAEAHRVETRADGLLDDVQMEQAQNPTCPGAIARLIDRAKAQSIAVRDLLRAAMRRQQEIA